MLKSGIDQAAMIDMFAQAGAKGGEQLRKTVGDATLAALQGRELTLKNIRGPSVAGDASQLEQLLVNLAMNAKDAIPGHGTVTIAADVISLQEVRQMGAFEIMPGDYVRITMTDTGVGIQADVKARLFEPF